MQDKYKITVRYLYSIYMKLLTGFLALQQENRLLSTKYAYHYQFLGNSACILSLLAL